MASSIPTGSIYSPSNADSWFGEKKTYQVGDVITVLLSESMNGSASATNEASRETSTDVLTAAQIARFGITGWVAARLPERDTDRYHDRIGGLRNHGSERIIDGHHDRPGCGCLSERKPDDPWRKNCELLDRVGGDPGQGHHTSAGRTA